MHELLYGTLCNVSKETSTPYLLFWNYNNTLYHLPSIKLVLSRENYQTRYTSCQSVFRGLVVPGLNPGGTSQDGLPEVALFPRMSFFAFLSRSSFSFFSRSSFSFFSRSSFSLRSRSSFSFFSCGKDKFKLLF